MLHIHPTFKNNPHAIEWGDVEDLVPLASMFSAELQLRCHIDAVTTSTGKCRTMTDAINGQNAAHFLESFLDVVLYAMQTLPKVAPNEKPVLKETLDGLRPIASDSWYNAALKEL